MTAASSDFRVMLVDDEPDIREIAAMALETVGGMTVRACASGREALDVVERFGPDIVLLDVMMPDMDGPGVLRELRTRPAARRTPVVFLTAKVRPEEVLRLKGEGACEVLGKPFDPMLLPDQVRACHHAALDTGVSSQTLDDKSAELRRRFRARVRDERGDLAEWARRIASNPAPDPAEADDLLRRAHRIAGTAGTLGLHALSAAAARLETALDAREYAAAERALVDLIAEIDRPGDDA